MVGTRMGIAREEVLRNVVSKRRFWVLLPLMAKVPRARKRETIPRHRPEGRIATGVRIATPPMAARNDRKRAGTEARPYGMGRYDAFVGEGLRPLPRGIRIATPPMAARNDRKRAGTEARPYRLDDGGYGLCPKGICLRPDQRSGRRLALRRRWRLAITGKKARCALPPQTAATTTKRLPGSFDPGRRCSFAQIPARSLSR